MPLVNPSEMLHKARAEGYCIGAFNIVDGLTLRAVVEAAALKRAPAIIQTSAATVRDLGIPVIAALTRLAAEECPVPLALHLDHGTDRTMIGEAIRGGYTAVMFDGSKYPFEENVARTREVVEEAHARGVAVEGEVGIVAGVEDDIVVRQDAAIYTTAEEAIEFQRCTGVDFLAPAIGTAHGFYRKEPRLDIDTLKRIAQAVPCPTVVHGGTGLSFDVLRRLVAAGAAKMNVSTQIKQTYIDSLHGYIDGKRSEYNPLKLLAHARGALVEMIGEYMDVFGSAGRV